MSLLTDVLSELFKMFVSDARLTASILALVGLAMAMIDATPLPPLSGGIALLLGSVAILVVSVRRGARPHSRSPRT